MTNGIDPCHFKDLMEMDPPDVCRRALCSYDSDSQGYTLAIWDADYGVYPGASRIVHLKNDTEVTDTFLSLFIVHYLLTSQERPITKEWISVKDIPGGATFFRGPHAIPGYLIEKRYGDDIDEFCEACEQLSGTPMDMADKAYSFKIAPRIPVAVLLWKGDDEFPAEAKLLFDKSIGDHLALDIIFAVAVELCSRLAK
ncbi:MAG: DUF3786 domain-containing protein [Deltaproteobacteria bacterium]|nr:DUF3786 domain-containing protein [Deltaproteobacteria bacterium]